MSVKINAVTRPTMRFVPVKSPEQQAALSMHRTRVLLVKQRTQSINMIRGLLAEFGVDIPKGPERTLQSGQAAVVRCGEERGPGTETALRCFVEHHPHHFAHRLGYSRNAVCAKLLRIGLKRGTAVFGKPL